jgi:16S rRNA processing protein RimM
MADARESGTPPLPDGASIRAGQSGEMRNWVWLARLRRPQGRKGELYADILTDFPEKFAERKRLWLLKENASTQAASRVPAQSPALPRQVTLANHWLHKGGIVLHFEGVSSISEAETLAGLIVAIPQEQRAPLAEDEAYVGDLMGCALFDVARGEPRAIGEIESVDRSAGPVPLLVVRRTEGKFSGAEILVPFAKSYLRKIDLEAKRIEMELPIGLVDLNEAETG